MVVGENDSIAYKKAKDISIGEQIWTVMYDEYVGESVLKDHPIIKSFTNPRLEKTTIIGIVPSVKATTVTINNDINKRFSLEERLFVKTDNGYEYLPVADIEIGQHIIIKNNETDFTEVEITDITFIDEDRNVYKFDASPIDTIIAGDILVHNVKLFT